MLLGSNAAELAASAFASLFVQVVACFVEGGASAQDNRTGHETNKGAPNGADGLRAKREVAKAFDDVLFWSLVVTRHTSIITQTVYVVNLLPARVGVY